MLKYNDREIVYSFEFGGYMTKKEKIIACSIFGVMLAMGLAFSIGFGITDENPFNHPMVWLGLFLIIFDAVAILIILLIPYIERKQDKQISEWLKADEILLYKVMPWEYKIHLTNTGARHYKFGIDFEFKDRKITKTSKKFNAFYKRIKDKPIEILYIPQYDQVLVLKDDGSDKLY